MSSHRPVPILVPRRADGGHRDRVWAWLRATLERTLPEHPIIEGRHEVGPFSRAAALNRAAREAPPWKRAIVLDADTYVDPEQIRRAVAEAEQSGRLTYAFDTLHALDRRGTLAVLDGYRRSWSRFVQWSRDARLSHSSAFVVPRPVWDRVGGFDEGFEGWGFEDVAFRRAVNRLTGPEVRVNGPAWHLWHPRSPHKVRNDEHVARARALGDRYKRADVAALEELVEQARRTRARTVAVLMANGRRTYLERTLPGFLRLVALPEVARVIVHDDSGDADFRKWLRGELADVDADFVETERAGYGGAMASAWSAAAATGCPLVFWLEEDFVLGDVPLAGMAALLEARGEVAQVVLKRQAWYPRELRAGGLIEGTPGDFVDVSDPVPHVEHRAFFSVNPTLFRAELLARPWLPVAGSEKRYGDDLLADQPHRVFALWGAAADPPAVEHVGADRTGYGY